MFYLLRRNEVLPLYQVNMDSFSSLVNLLKVIIMLWCLSINSLDTNGYMEWEPRMKCSRSQDNGTATLSTSQT
jgi:hypothetical protein